MEDLGIYSVYELVGGWCKVSLVPRLYLSLGKGVWCRHVESKFEMVVPYSAKCAHNVLGHAYMPPNISGLECYCFQIAF